MKVYEVSGNNEGLYTPTAYKELRLQLSTGDFHTHTAKLIDVPDGRYHDVIQLADLVPGACTICERVADAVVTEEHSFPICSLCAENYLLHSEAHAYEGEMKRLRDRFYDAITFKQFNRISHGDNYFESLRAVTKSAKLLGLIDELQDLAAIHAAYKAAQDENDAVIKAQGGFKFE